MFRMKTNFITKSGSYNNPCKLVFRVNAFFHSNHVSFFQYFFYRNSHLLNAMNVNKMPKLRNIYKLDLLRNAMYSQSQATTFYNFIINSGSYNNPCNLVSKVNTICHTNHVSFMQYIFNDKYYTDSRRSMKIVYTHGTDCFTYRIKLLLKNYTYYDKEMLKLFLTPF